MRIHETLEAAECLPEHGKHRDGSRREWVLWECVCLHPQTRQVLERAYCWAADEWVAWSACAKERGWGKATLAKDPQKVVEEEARLAIEKANREKEAALEEARVIKARSDQELAEMKANLQAMQAQMAQVLIKRGAKAQK